jgi:uncharacterized protein (TIGR02145 family)
MKKALLFIAVLALALVGCTENSPAPIPPNNPDDTVPIPPNNPNDTVGGGGDISNMRTIEIGRLTWTGENLNVRTPYSYCYNNSPDSCAKYGRLYTIDAAIAVCQSMGEGWRLPTREDLNHLVDVVGGGSTLSVGKKLKSTDGWYYYSGGKGGNGTDDYGFTALPGGSCSPCGLVHYSDLRFKDARVVAQWWSTWKDIDNNESGCYYYVFSGFDQIVIYEPILESSAPSIGTKIGENVNIGYSVRCVKDLID